MSTDYYPCHLRRLRFVPRWSVMPTVGTQQYVDGHSYHVTWIYLLLCERERRQPTLSELWDVLAHDSKESITGDSPSPHKHRGKSTEQRAKLAPAYECRLKVADTFEALLFIQEELKMGNHTMSAVMDRHWTELAIWVAEYAAKTEQAATAVMGLLYSVFDQCDPKLHPVMSDAS